MMMYVISKNVIMGSVLDAFGNRCEANVMYTDRERRQVMAYPMRSPLSAGIINTITFRKTKIKTGEYKFSM